MSKQKPSADAPDAMVAPPPVAGAADDPTPMPSAPSHMAAPPPRIRNLDHSPTCPACGSPMDADGFAPTNHPFRRLRYWRCRKVGCAYAPGGKESLKR